MRKPIIDDELWALIEPLLPPPKPRRFNYPGRKPVPDRAALAGILLLKTGIRWRDFASNVAQAFTNAFLKSTVAWSAVPPFSKLNSLNETLFLNSTVYGQSSLQYTPLAFDDRMHVTYALIT